MRHKIGINFNNLRKQALYTHDGLVDKLNRSIITDNQWAKPNDVHHGQEIAIKGYVLIDADDIQSEMDDLRMLIGTLASCSLQDADAFKDIYSEVYPNEDDRMNSFNNEH